MSVVACTVYSTQLYVLYKASVRNEHNSLAIVIGDSSMTLSNIQQLISLLIKILMHATSRPTYELSCYLLSLANTIWVPPIALISFPLYDTTPLEVFYDAIRYGMFVATYILHVAKSVFVRQYLFPGAKADCFERDYFAMSIW